MASKKDYDGIAKAIREAQVSKRDKQKIASKIADYFEKDNPRFLRGVFLVACEAWETTFAEKA